MSVKINQKKSLLSPQSVFLSSAVIFTCALSCSDGGSSRLKDQSALTESIDSEKPKVLGKLNQCLEVGAEDFGIIGGTLLSEKHSLANSMGLLFAKHKFTLKGLSKDSTSLCTATLLDKQVLITAAHCVVPLSVIGSYGISLKDIQSEFYFVKGAQPFCGLGETEGFDGLMNALNAVKAEAVLAHSEFFNEEDQDIKLQNDLALIKLPDSADTFAVPIKLSTMRALEEKEPHKNKIFISGYGVTSSLGDDDGLLPALRFAQTDISNQSVLQDLGDEISPVAKKEFELEFSQPLESRDTILLSNLAEGKNACSGDSGGPAVVVQGGALLQFGVASRVENFDTLRDPCSVAVRYINLGKNRKWIEEKFDSIKGSSIKKSQDLFVN